MRLSLTTLAGLAAAAILSGCTTAELIEQDKQLCTMYGAQFGSPAHYQCMLIQQERRDLNGRIAAHNAAVALRGMSW